MSADFIPSRNTYKTLGSFRFWCQKVLPQVYDDSLSYYELLNKVVDYLNEVNENADGLNDDVTAMYTAFKQLQDYVNDWFSGLNVQEQVNNKIQNMVDGGEFEEIVDAFLQPLFDEYAETSNATINAAITRQDTSIANAVSAQNTEIDNATTRLNDRLTQAVTSQNTLIGQNTNAIDVLESRVNAITSLPSGSTSGDAELTDIRVAYTGATYASAGDAVRAQAENNHSGVVRLINLIGDDYTVGSDIIATGLQTGYKISNVGVAVAAASAKIDSYPVVAGSVISVELYADFEDCTYIFQNTEAVTTTVPNMNIIGGTVGGIFKGDINGFIKVPEGATYLCVSSNTANDVNSVKSCTRDVLVGTDTTLSLSGVAADAKATGDEINGLKSAFDSLTNKTENVLHTLLTETTPLGTYGNSVSNGYLWIFKDIPIPKGQSGLVRVLTTGGNRTYRFCTLKKNSDTSYTIITNETKLSPAVSVDEYEISADSQDVYIGLYSADGALVFSSTNVGANDGISRALYQDFINGEGTATTAILGSSLNFGFALTTYFNTVSSGFPIKIVDKNGHGDFTTISDAINSTNDGDTILIMPGTYFEQVKMWGKNRHLVGLSKENTIIASTSRYYNNEPLQANIGSVTNLTFIAGYGLTPIENDTSSTSYAIHIEYANDVPFEFLIDNCNIISNVAPAVGMGVRYNQTIRVRNSRLETKAKNMYSSVYDNYFNVGGIFCHNDASGSGLGTDGRVEVTDCELKGVLTAITFQSQDNGNTLACRFVNNLLWSTQNGKTDAVTIRTPATQGHLAGSDVLLDAMSFGNNVSELNA